MVGKMGEEAWEVQASSYRISHKDKTYSTGNKINGVIIWLRGDRR